MKLAVAGLTLAALSTTAFAQPGNVDPQPYPAPLEPQPYPADPQPYAMAPQPRPQPVVAHDTVDPGVATGLSLGGTALAWGMLIVAGRDGNENEGLATAGAIGTMFAPSFGHWYAHHGFSRGLGLRLVGLTAAVIGFGMALDDLLAENDDGDEGAAAGLMLVGAGLYIGGTIDDIATAGSAARKYNSRFESVGVVPTLNAHGGGVSLAGRF
jgi:hypothetical protein